MLLRPTLARYDVRFATTEPAVAAQHGIADVESLPDCNQNMPVRSALCALVALWVVLKHRPKVILSTGAAPGFREDEAGRGGGRGGALRRMRCARSSRSRRGRLPASRLPATPGPAAARR